MGAAYAVYDASIQLLPECRVLNFGGAPGATDDRRAGLARFKRGFANATAPSFLCGKVLDVDAYNELARQAGAVADGDFFPGYRQSGS